MKTRVMMCCVVLLCCSVASAGIFRGAGRAAKRAGGAAVHAVGAVIPGHEVTKTVTVAEGQKTKTVVKSCPTGSCSTCPFAPTMAPPKPVVPVSAEGTPTVEHKSGRRHK